MTAVAEPARFRSFRGNAFSETRALSFLFDFNDTLVSLFMGSMP